MKNLLFIPCYQCAPQIVRVMESLRPYSKYFTEIIIIDNLSPDSTAHSASEWLKKNPGLPVKVVLNPANVGLGGSHKLAFQYGIENGFDHVVILHGDDQGDLKDITSLLKEMQSSCLNSFWMGARFHPSSKLIGYSPVRILGNLVFNVLSTLLATKTIHDLGGSGVNIFPVKLIKAHPYLSYSNDLTFHVYLLLNAIRLKQEVNFIPVSWREDDQISNVKLFSQSMKLMGILSQYLLHRSLLSEREMTFPYSPSEWVPIAAAKDP